MATSAGTSSFSAGPSFPGVDGLAETEKNSGEPENTYILRPIFQQRRVANGDVAQELRECWFGQMGFDRYKMVVQVVIGEQRGEGVFMAARCFWDADTDNYTHDVFMNDSLFCVVAAFGCFYY
ncbi:tctex1 domain-containing protein 2 [Octodon degus]|uniref:Tctex1 domain-containing protein 2 n=1 Tax=Octodon degus TaxID=10160 RepID=A0A6P3FF78_OCTDE|nr:tctex1 domain-containing protein 2 [Octodon degus]